MDKRIHKKISEFIQDCNPYMNPLIAHQWYIKYQTASAKDCYYYITYFNWNSQVDRAYSCANYFQNYTIEYCKTFIFVKRIHSWNKATAIPLALDNG